MAADRGAQGQPTVAPAQEGGLASLFGTLARDAGLLIRQEIALAKAEAIDRFGQFFAGAYLYVVGAAVLLAGLPVLLAAAALALALVVPAWAAALIVGGAVELTGLALFLKGRRDVRARNLVPTRTWRTLREDAEWAKEQAR